MNTEIVIALILGAASIISSVFFGLVPSIRKAKIEKQNKKIYTLLKDIESFYEIESELLDELSTVTGKNKETTKRDVRKRVRATKNYSISDYSSPSNLIQEIRRYENS